MVSCNVDYGKARYLNNNYVILRIIAVTAVSDIGWGLGINLRK
jgi:hypothetical protein